MSYAQCWTCSASCRCLRDKGTVLVSPNVSLSVLKVGAPLIEQAPIETLHLPLVSTQEPEGPQRQREQEEQRHDSPGQHVGPGHLITSVSLLSSCEIVNVTLCVSY